MQTFQGGVFADSLTDKRSSASLRVTSGTVSAETPEKTIDLPLFGLQLEEGGASGRMIFCRHPSAPGTTFHCEVPGFLAALDASGPKELGEAIQVLRATKKRKRLFFTLGMGAVIAALIAAFMGFQSVVASSADLIPYSIDESIGELASKQMVGSMGLLVHDEVVVDAIQSIVDRLAPASSLDGVTYSLQIVESDQVNAFALPGGHMVVFTGLIAKSDSPEEVAAVIGHEMAHVTQRHGIRRLLGSVGLLVAVQVLLGDVGGATVAVQELFTIAAVNGYSRTQESEADAEGIRMLHASGISPEGAVTFFQKLKDEETALEKSGILDWIGTHPDHEARIQDLRALIDTLDTSHVKPLDLPWEDVKARVSRKDDIPIEEDSDSQVLP